MGGISGNRASFALCFGTPPTTGAELGTINVSSRDVCITSILAADCTITGNELIVDVSTKSMNSLTTNPVTHAILKWDSSVGSIAQLSVTVGLPGSGAEMILPEVTFPTGTIIRLDAPMKFTFKTDWSY